MTDTAARRVTMVDTQVRPSDVTKFPIIDAMLTIQREAFVPDAQRDIAYAGAQIDIAPGRAICEPRTLAKTLDALDVGPGDLVLVVGAGLGYSAAILAHLSEAVIAVEELPELAANAEASLAAEGIDNAAVFEGPLAAGSAKHGPYNVILVDGGVETMPDALIEQLRDGGRIAATFMTGALGEVRIGQKVDGRMSWWMEFNAAAPVLPGFERAASFVL